MYKRLLEHLTCIVERVIKQGEMPSGLGPTAIAGFYLAFYMGMELQLALIEGLDSPKYIERIKKILVKQEWHN